MTDTLRYEMDPSATSCTRIEACRFNMSKGLWETDPLYWAVLPEDRGSVFVGIGFPLATSLIRGVSA